MQQHIGFKLESGEYAVPITRVREIISMPEITALPDSPPVYKGVTNLRGSVIPVVDAGLLIGLGGKAPLERKVIVMVCGRMTFGILVDGITGVVNIDEKSVESPETLPNGKAAQITGVAKIGSRIVVLLDPAKLVPLNDPSLLEEGAAVADLSVQAAEAADFISRQKDDAPCRHKELRAEMQAFLEAISSHDYERADASIENIIRQGQNELYQEIGKITRKLHDSVRSFKEAIDPKIRALATSDVPSAVDKLQFVIDKTEEAANKTMGIVEKYIMTMDEVAGHIRKIEGPRESAEYLKKFKNDLESDLTTILTTQSFQDLTGQTIKKVITLVSEIETELVSLIANFGVKTEAAAAPADVAKPEKVSQAGVDDLLKEFGF